MGEPIIFALAGLPVPGSVLAIAGVVLAVIIVLAVIFFTRNAKKNNSAAPDAGPTGTEPWQRQSQAGMPGQQGGWGAGAQQPGQMGQQEQWNPQQAGGWNAQAPQANSWNQPADKTAQPGGWNAQANNPASQPGGWNAGQPAAQPGGWNAQPNNPASQPGGWNAGQQAAQPGGWNAQPNNPASQPGGWNAGQPAAQPGGWNAQQPQANPWGNSPASQNNQQESWNQPQQPAAAPGWGNPAPNPAQPSLGGTQGWNDPNPAQQPSPQNAWSPSAQPMNPSGGLSNPSAQNQPGWQQPGGFGASPVAQDNATLYSGGADVDKTVLRGPQGQIPGQGIGMVRVEEGKEIGRIYEVRKPSLSIGRSRESDIFLEDLAVSRLHASIVDLGNNAYAVKDEGSANGTKVNGQQLSKYQTYTLQEGDRVQLGQTVLVFGRR
ncbi:MAG TPA: FHA domain-containing protein [Ktedonobacteraceae bacterium]|nr:FHA domain-containing protein [Ktedonobacteraceae bacterium]